MEDSVHPNTKSNFARKWKRFFSGSLHGAEDVTEEEIISMVKEGHEQGVIPASEAEMIHNIFEFGDKEAKDIMTHRKNIVAINADWSYCDTVSFMIESGKSRYPVYEENIDRIIGILHIKDAFTFFPRNEVFRSSIKDIDGLLRDVEFIPETMNIHKLFKTMQSEKSHLVVVIDEYGQTAGIVAMEDILEEIVGNIEDEHDEEDQKMIQRAADGTYRMDGMTTLPEVIDVLHIPVDEDSFDTLNGLLISMLGKIPSDGEASTIEAFGYRFEILHVEDKIIRQVAVSRMENAHL